MAEVVAEGVVIVRAKENVRAELAKAEAAFDRTMERLDGKEAELKLGADTKELYAKIRKAQADLEKWERQKATATLDVETRQANAGIANATGRLKKFEKENVRIVNRINELDRSRGKAIADLADKREAGERKIARAVEDAANRASKAAETESKRRAAAAKRAATEVERGRQREERAAERAAAAVQRASAKEAAAREKTLGQSARLERQYIDLRKKRERFEKAASRVFLPQRDRELINFDIRGVNEQIAEVEGKLASIGKPPPEVEIHLDTDDRGAAALSRWINAISTTTVRLGPFTTTVAGAGRALAILGPIITGIVGSLGALTGAIGSAALGFGGAMTAGVGAFGLVLGSTALLMKPLMKDFKNLNQLQDAYHKQVLKTGAGSGKAKEKLQEFEHAMGEVPATTKAAFLGIDDLGKSFDRVAMQARPAFLNTFAEGLTTAQAGLRRFGPEMVQSFKIVSGGISNMFRSLRGPAATGIIGTLFDNGQKALPAFGRGLGNLAASAGRVAAAFSRMLTPLGSGFENWTKRFSDFTKDSSKLNSFVDKTVTSMRSFGNLLQSTGGFLATFFGAGVESGVGLMDRMANGLDRISNNIRNNPRGLKDFFANSVDTAQRLYGVLRPLAALFIEWATLMTPFTNIILDVIAAFADLAAGIAAFGPIRGLLTTAFGVFLAGSLIAKIRGVTQAVAALAASLTALGGKQAALRAGAALTGGALASIGAGAAAGTRGVTAATVATGAVAGRAAGRLDARDRVSAGGVVLPGSAGAAKGITQVAGAATKGAKAVSALKIGLTGVGAVLGIANPIFGAAALGVAGLAAGYIYLKHRNDDLKASVRSTADATLRTADAYRGTSSSLADTASAATRANLVVRQARRDLAGTKKGTDEWRLANLNLNDALRARSQSQQAVAETQRENVRLAGEQVQRSGDQLKAFDALNRKRMSDNQKDINDDLRRYGELSIDSQHKQRELNKLQERRNQLVAAAAQAVNRQAAAEINNSRGLQGMLPLLGRAEQQLGSYVRQAGKASATKIALNFRDSGDAGKVAAAAGRAIKAGVPKNVATRIAVSTKDAELAVARLNKAKLTPKRLTIVEQGGQRAIAMIEQLTGRKVPKKDVEIVEKGGAGAMAVLARLLGVKLPPKTQGIKEAGAAAVIASLMRVNGLKLTDKQMTAMARDLASGKINSIIGLINSIPSSRTSTITTIYNTIRREDRVTGKGRFAQGGVFAAASGMASAALGKIEGPSRRIAGESFTSPALERTISAAYKRAAVTNPRKSVGEIVRRPQLLVGEQGGQPEYVIATNPAFRERNVGLLQSAASRFGMRVVAAAKGKGDPKKKAATPRQLANARKQATKRRPKRTNYSSDDIRELPLVEEAKIEEDNQLRRISIAESRLKEPSTFLTTAGTDPITGEPIYQIDTGAVSAWSSQLADISGMYSELIVKIRAVGTAVTNALTAVKTVISRTVTNIATIDGLRKAEQRTLDRNGTSKAAKGAAKARMKIYDEAKTSELESQRNAKSDQTNLLAEERDYPFRITEAEIKRDEYSSDSAAVAGRAQTALAESTPSLPDPVNPSDLAIARAEAALSTAELTPTTDDDIAAQNQIIAAHRAKINQANAMLADNNPYNDIDAYQSISSSSNAIRSAQEAVSGAAAVAGNNYRSLGEARRSLYTSFGNNSASFLGPGFRSAAAGYGNAAGNGAMGAGPVVNNYFSVPPPDAHTWSQGIAFELNTLV